MDILEAFNSIIIWRRTLYHMRLRWTVWIVVHLVVGWKWEQICIY